MVASVNVAIGKYKAHTLLNIISAGIFVFLCFGLVRYGLVAISFAFLLYSIVSFCFSFWLIYVNVHVHPFELFKAIWCPLVGSVLMLCVVLILRCFVFSDYGSFLQLICQVGVGAVMYFGWSYYFYRKGVVSFRIQGVNQ